MKRNNRVDRGEAVVRNRGENLIAGFGRGGGKCGDEAKVED